MKTEAEYSEIVNDCENIIATWVCHNLNTDTSWLSQYHTYGIRRGHKMIAGLIFHDLHFGSDVWWTIYAEDKRWCNRRILKFFMFEAFHKLHCRRINLLVDTDNLKCLRFVTRLGFQIEGKLRQFRDNGKDCYILGLLKQDSKYL